MPPKAKITKEMIIDAGFEIVREHGIENVNARTVSEKLNCSTQPVMYHFKKIEDLKEAIYQKADEVHTAYIMDIQRGNPMLAAGLSYIRFAQTEKNLFRFLFQSNRFSGKCISELINAEETAPIITLLSETAGISLRQAKEVFQSLFLFVHGSASMFANNSMNYDEEAVISDLKRLYRGAILSIEEDTE